MPSLSLSPKTAGEHVPFPPAPSSLYSGFTRRLRAGVKFRGCYGTRQTSEVRRMSSFRSQLNVALFRSVLLKRHCQAGISEYVRHSLEVVGHDGETEFGVGSCSSAQEEAWMPEDTIFDGCERVFND